MSEAALEAVRGALAGAEAWVVGGAVRDELLGRDVSDVDVAVAGDAKPLARALARASGSGVGLVPAQRRLRRLARDRARTRPGRST